MRIKDVEPAEWLACLDSFSRRHAHEAATIEVHDPQHGPAAGLFQGPLLGAELERDPDGHESIFLAIGDRSAPHWGRVIAHPRVVSLYQDLDGRDQALAIESDDGGYTVIQM